MPSWGHVGRMVCVCMCVGACRYDRIRHSHDIPITRPATKHGNKEQQANERPTALSIATKPTGEGKPTHYKNYKSHSACCVLTSCGASANTKNVAHASSATRGSACHSATNSVTAMRQEVWGARRTQAMAARCSRATPSMSRGSPKLPAQSSQSGMMYWITPIVRYCTCRAGSPGFVGLPTCGVKDTQMLRHHAAVQPPQAPTQHAW